MATEAIFSPVISLLHLLNILQKGIRSDLRKNSQTELESTDKIMEFPWERLPHASFAHSSDRQPGRPVCSAPGSSPLGGSPTTLRTINTHQIPLSQPKVSTQAFMGKTSNSKIKTF